MSHEILKQARCTVIALFLLAAMSAPAIAHPHVWIDMKVDLSFDDAKKLDSLTVTWTFDEFYSAFAVQDFRKRPDGSYDPADLAKLAEVNLTNLKDWNYFTEVMQGGKPLKLGTPTHGASSYDAKAGTLTMTFTLPVAPPAAATASLPVEFRIYDPSYYIAIDYVKKDAIRLAIGNHDGCAVSMTIPDAEEIWSSLPESAFNGPKAVSLGKNFASTATLICKG
jgi:ABC-type uncharacterized transport system substrate-binding protein